MLPQPISHYHLTFPTNLISLFLSSAFPLFVHTNKLIIAMGASSLPIEKRLRLFFLTAEIFQWAVIHRQTPNPGDDMRTGFDVQPYLGFGGIVNAKGTLVEVFRGDELAPALRVDVTEQDTSRHRCEFADIVPLMDQTNGRFLAAVVLHNPDVIDEEDLSFTEDGIYFEFEQGDFAVLYISRDGRVHNSSGLYGFTTEYGN